MNSTHRIIRRFSSNVEKSGFKHIGVVGLGLMGHGIAQMAAKNGFTVTAVENKQDALDVGMKRIQTSFSKVVAKDVKTGKKTEAEGKAYYEQTLARIRPSTDIHAVKDCDLVVEAIIEIEKVKLDFYTNLGKIASANTVFASNTSSLPITNMALASGRPQQFVGLHFFNPVQIMKLVEVIRTTHTSPEVFDRVYRFSREIEKVPVAAKDTPGFIVNRLLVPYMAQAMALVDRGDASVADIDEAMKLGAGHPMGPLTLADYVGHDINYNVMKGWREAYPNEPTFFVPKCLEELVQKGHLGRKSGRGFYEWNGDKPGKALF
mmetsp:Transcript_20751/g.22563  ORF Transcript_20751/g.22563 Transcript_20751/m.22563 type:complete len:319 (+) Transcript_20751:73-1029(+)